LNEPERMIFQKKWNEHGQLIEEVNRNADGRLLSGKRRNSNGKVIYDLIWNEEKRLYFVKEWNNAGQKIVESQLNEVMDPLNEKSGMMLVNCFTAMNGFQTKIKTLYDNGMMRGS